ncbi:MAG: hypothetical protein FD165_1422 [Gammaproteobacteria bacterium]|nr:MAG: hypothetical protein FD165_1422 [Gammaproteobacteria bacterium]TND03990.1 MAG: hypothetical protein FD120_1699 [Gammaproteobacteria bacterium]
MQKRSPDLIVILALFVGIGVVVTATVQGAEFAPAGFGHTQNEFTHAPHHRRVTSDFSAGDPLKWVLSALPLRPTLMPGEISVDLYGVDIGFRDDQNFTQATGGSYWFVGVEHRW